MALAASPDKKQFSEIEDSDDSLDDIKPVPMIRAESVNITKKEKTEFKK
jgi:hypothetical protein